MSHQGRYPGQTLGVVGQPARAVTSPQDRPGLPEMSEVALWRAKRQSARPCLCHGLERMPWEDWTAEQWAEYEARQRHSVMATIAEERAGRKCEMA